MFIYPPTFNPPQYNIPIGSTGQVLTNIGGRLGMQTPSGGAVTAGPGITVSGSTVLFTSGYTTTAYATTITPVANTWVRIIATGALTIDPPSSPVDGAEVRLWITASGGNQNLTLAAGIVVPSSSTYTNPYTIPLGKKVKVMLQYDATLNGGQWELTSLIGNY